MRLHSPNLAAGVAFVAAASICATVGAQCTEIDFDSYSTGTVITTQIDGVTFYADPESCGGGYPKPVIVSPGQGTSSGTRALGIQTGCPDFSPDILVMEFDELQRYVTFSLGEQTSTGNDFTIRAYNAGGGLVQIKGLTTGGGVFHQVKMGSPTGAKIIKKIEIEEEIGLFETIDDLSFNMDTTPPTAEIHSPIPSDCICDGVVNVTGIACDFDGEYGMDKLEYRSRGADPDDPWILVGTYTSPVCELGNLYNWDVTSVAHGWYYLRLTVENACGLTDTAVTSAYVDKTFGTVKIDSPADGGTVCGKVDIKGTVNDSCGHCLDQYIVMFKPQSGGSWMNVDPAHPTYTDLVINGDLAVWDTDALGLADGVYYLVVEGEDECGNTENVQIKVLLDSSSCGCVADFDDSGEVDVLDLLELLGAWGPCP